MRRRVVIILSLVIPALALAGYFLWAHFHGEVGPPSETAAMEIYEAVFQHRAQKVDNKEAIYLFVEGADPPDDVLRKLRARWPTLQPFSQLPKKARGNWVWSVSQLKWLDANTAEIRGTFNNGIDGRIIRYRVVRKDGTWQVENATTEALS